MDGLGLRRLLPVVVAFQVSAARAEADGSALPVRSRPSAIAADFAPSHFDSHFRIDQSLLTVAVVSVGVADAFGLVIQHYFALGDERRTPAALGWMEIAWGAAHVVVGSCVLDDAVSSPDWDRGGVAAAVSAGALVLGTWFLTHGLTVLVRRYSDDPSWPFGSPENDAAAWTPTVGMAPTAEGVTGVALWEY